MAEDKDGGEKKSGGGEEGNKEVTKSGSKAVVLKVDFHCEGCASKIIKCAKAFEGVEKVRVEWEASKLTVEGKVDPAKLRERLQEKTKKKVELVSPQLSKDKKDKDKDTTTTTNSSDSNKDQGKKADEKRPKELPATTVVLKLGLHCQGCVQKIHKFVSKTSGVNSVKIERQKDLVMITGTMDVKALVKALKGRMKREVEVIPPKPEKEKGNSNEEKKKEGSANGNGGGKMKSGGGRGGGNCGNAGGDKEEPDCVGRVDGSRMEYFGTLGHLANTGYGCSFRHGQWCTYGENVHAPQYFSDENPNACSVM